MAGAQFVRDVTDFETMKLRCLNGTHSALAYLGYLAGYQTISETVADPGFSKFIEHLWRNEIIPTVPQPEGEDLQAYCQALLHRYQNSIDCPQNMANRDGWVAKTASTNTRNDCRQPRRRPTHRLVSRSSLPRGCAMSVGLMKQAIRIDVRDPLADVLRAASDAGGVEGLLAIEQVFDPVLAENPTFRKAVFAAYQDLTKAGVKSVVHAFSS